MFFQPQTNWKVPNPMLPWDDVVRAIQQHRMANPRFAAQWSTETEDIEAELDAFTCLRISFNPNYCTGGSFPKARTPLPGRAVAGSRFAGIGKRVGAAVENVRKLYSGVGVLLDWVGSGGKVVSQEQANARATVCADCPKNELGGIESFFTAPAAEKIRKQLALKNEMELRTPLDDRLGTCTVCLCRMSLKVWVPLEHVVKKLKPEWRAELPEHCWVVKESA